MSSQRTQQRWLDEATESFDKEGGFNAVAELLARGHVAYYTGVIDGYECYLKEYPSGRLEEVTEDYVEKDTVLRVIRE